MSIAKKIKIPSIDPGAYADLFIKEMHEQTGCSQTFLQEARPSLVKLYKDVKGEALENCLNDVRTLIQQQADTERICEKARENAKSLEQVQNQLGNELQNLQKQVLEMRDSIRASAFTLFSMKRGHHGDA